MHRMLERTHVRGLTCIDSTSSRKFAQRQISLASSMENAASSGREITFYANKTETPFSHGNLSRHPPRRIADRAPKKARISLSRVERQPRSICFPTSTLPIVATVQPRRKQENATNPYPYALFVGSQTLIIAFCFVIFLYLFLSLVSETASLRTSICSFSFPYAAKTRKGAEAR